MTNEAAAPVPAPLSLTVRDEQGAVDLTVEADPAGSVADLCALAVREGGLATQDAGGRPVRYVLALKREGRFLEPGRSLREEGLRTGDVLELVTKMVGGRDSAAARRRANDRTELTHLSRGSAGVLELRPRGVDEVELALRQRHLIGPGRFAEQSRFVMSFPSEYPQVRPIVRFLAPVPFHPNVYTSGVLCINEWRPSMRVSEFVETIVTFLASRDMNLSSPANPTAYAYYREQGAALGRSLVPARLAAGAAVSAVPQPGPQFRVVSRRV